MAPMIVVIPVAPNGEVGGHFGKAHFMAVADVREGAIVDWRVDEVAWDVQHDLGTHGSHHARIVRFMLDNQVEAVCFTHMGPPMMNTLTKLGLTLLPVTPGDAREQVLSALASL